MFTQSFALGLLASTASAAFDASSSSNVAMYWGQGSGQISLKEVCSDPSIDIVNMAFVNQFPKRRGEYPATNFANACEDQWYTDEFGQESGLRSNCPTVAEGMKTCRDNGKKVLLSIGGGYPVNYYLESQDIAEYLADFLWGAFGPPSADWKAQGKPRPFGDQYVDGFDLHLEAFMDPAPFDGYEYANYHHLVSRWKNVHFPSHGGDFYISGAPQCQVPDAFLADAISKSHFDFIFTMFYNTVSCNSRRGYEGLDAPTTAFTFDTWVEWLTTHSTVNPNVKLYIGLPSDNGAALADPSAYLTPNEANDLISFYQAKHPQKFGGVMIWEATRNSKTNVCGQTYSTHIKSILQGSYDPEVCPSPTSSSIASTSTAVATPTAISQDGTCGPESGNTCAGSTFGDCCSQYNYCGSTELYCSAENCNPLYGNCEPTKETSPNGSCGPENGGYTCEGYFMGECCSQYGYCGSTELYCSAENCNPLYGNCGAPSSSSVARTITSTSMNGQPTKETSPNGSCGPENGGYTCEGYFMGECCSEHGYCGGSSSYCDAGCQPNFGKCTSSNNNSSLSAILDTGSSSIFSGAPSAPSAPAAPFPTVANSTSVQFPTGTAPSIITSSSVSHTVGTGSSGIVTPSASAPFATGANSSSISQPTGTSSHVVSTPSTPGASSSIVTPAVGSLAPYPVSNVSDHAAYPTNGHLTNVSASTASSTADGYPVYSGPSHPAHTSGAGQGYKVESTHDAVRLSSSPSHPIQTDAGYPVYTPESGEGYPVKSTPSSGADHDGYSTGPSVTSKPIGSSSYPTSATTTCYTTTYVDICPTGLTTITATVTKTYEACPKCVVPTLMPNEVPEGWTTTVAVCGHCGPKTTTVTLTKPVDAPVQTPYHAAPSHGTAPSSPAEKPQSPHKDETAPAAHPTGVTHFAGTEDQDAHSSAKGESAPAAYPTGESHIPSVHPEEVSVISKVYMTAVPVPGSEAPSAATPAPYLASNGTAGHGPSGTAHSSGKGEAYPTVSPSKVAAFEGAASRFSVSTGALVVLGAGLFLL